MYDYKEKWDYSTNHIGDQWRLRRACASVQSRQSLHCSHTWSMEVNEGSGQKPDIQLYWMAGCACLKNECMEEEKCHELTQIWKIFSKLSSNTHLISWRTIREVLQQSFWRLHITSPVIFELGHCKTYKNKHWYKDETQPVQPGSVIRAPLCTKRLLSCWLSMMLCKSWSRQAELCHHWDTPWTWLA